MTYTEERKRMTCEVESHAHAIDSILSELPSVWRGIDWRFDWRFTLCNQLVGVDGITSLTMEIKPLSNITGAPLLTHTISSTAIDNTLTPSTWADGTKQHAHFEFSHTNTNLDLGGKPSAQFWAVVKGLTSDSPSKRVVMGVTLLNVDEAGANDGEPPSPGNPSYYTAAQCDAKFIGPIFVDDPLYEYVDSSGRTHISINPDECTEGMTIQYLNGRWTKGDPTGALYLRCAKDNTIHKVTVDKPDNGLGYQLALALNQNFPL